MPRTKRATYTTNQTPTTLQPGFFEGLETQLWAAADKMRSHMDPGEYKHVVLGLIFLKYISDRFEERYEQLRLFVGLTIDEYRLLSRHLFGICKY